MALTTSARLGVDRSRRDPTAAWRHLDPVLIVCTLALAALGVLMVYSATKGSGTGPITSYAMRQATFTAIGIVVMGLVALVDYNRFHNWAWVIYGMTIFTLVAVISPLGQRSKGAQAWFGFGPFQLQPGEFSKLSLILALGALLARYKGDIDLKRIVILLGVAGVPIALIMLQPDLGMVLIMVAILLGMLLVGGLRGRYILAITVIGVIGVIGVLNSSVLHQYQKDRLTAFVDPNNTSPEAVYNVRQSQITIASGGVAGDGLFQGHQTQLRFVPEQQTDFIFTAVGEELGFVGAATALVLYAVIIWRVWRTAKLARDQFGALLCVGVVSMLVFQVFENVGMTMGIMPVTGIPLPFLSYGGSSILTTFAAVGVALNVHMRRFR